MTVKHPHTHTILLHKEQSDIKLELNWGKAAISVIPVLDVDILARPID